MTKEHKRGDLVSSPRDGPIGRGYKICHVAGTTVGGTWMFEQLRELRDRHGFEVCAVVSGDTGPLIDKLQSAGIRYHVADFATGPGSWRAVGHMPLAAIKLARFFRSERFDVVQSHIFISMRTARPAAWLANVPVRIAMIAGPYHLEAHTSRWMERATFWMETLQIPTSFAILDLCRKIKIPEKYLGPIIYYGPDERKFDPEQIFPADIRAEFGWPNDTPLISLVSYFYPRLAAGKWVPKYLQNRGLKGHEDLIKAASIVLKEFPNAKFLLVGSGFGDYGTQYRDEMKELVRTLNLESSVIFPGFREDANRILRAVDVAVIPSLNENLDGTIEALLMRCPTVATRVGGLIDSVKDEETGLLVNPEDPEDLARGIIRLLKDRKKAQAFGLAGRELMLKRFTLTRTVDDLAELYQRLLSKNKRKSEFHGKFVSGLRFLIAAPLFAYIVFRMLFIDIYLPIYVPVYTRIYLARIRAMPSRIFHVFLPLVAREVMRFRITYRLARPVYRALRSLYRFRPRRRRQVAEESKLQS